MLLFSLYISRTNTKFSSESLDTFVARHAKKINHLSVISYCTRTDHVTTSD